MAVFTKILNISDGVQYIPFKSISGSLSYLYTQYTWDSLDGDIEISLLQANENDETIAQPIEDVDEQSIICSIITPDGTDFVISKSFYGEWGFIKLDPKTATTGTIKLIPRWAGDQSFEE